MSELRLCTVTGCTAPKHYENCRSCFGFGVYEDDGKHHATPVSASEATGDSPKLRAAIVCPECGSTAAGAPSGNLDDGWTAGSILRLPPIHDSDIMGKA